MKRITALIALGLVSISLPYAFAQNQDAGQPTAYGPGIADSGMVSDQPMAYGPGIADSGVAPGSSSGQQQPPSLGPGVDNFVRGGVPSTTDNSGSDTQPSKSQDAPAGDCIEPSNVNLNKDLAEEADIVITGIVVAAGPAEIVCAPANTTLKSLASAKTSKGGEATDMLVAYSNKTAAADDNITLMVAVQCVHKGALACRRNSVDARTEGALMGRCVVAVQVPAQKTSKGDKLKPCSATPGFKYMMMLSHKPAAKCDGAYTIYHPRVVDSVRPHLGGNNCPPYPAWPSQSTKLDGDGLAGLVSNKCPGSPNPKKVKCQDTCKELQCAPETAVTCVPKSCEGRYMMNTYVTSKDPCQPVFINTVTGLPVAGCDVTQQRLVRQARQSQRRLGLATGELTPADLGVNPSDPSRPRLVDPEKLFGGSLLGVGQDASGSSGLQG